MSHIISTPRIENPPPSRRARRWSDRSLGSTLREIALMATMFMLYRQVRHLTSGDIDQAMVNADRVVGLERSLGAFSEGSLQRLVLNSRLAIEFLDHYYVFVHFTASFGFMAWVFLRHPEAWGRIRSWFLSVTLAGLVIHVVFPLAPPRMLGDEGFVDTLHVYGPSIYSRDVTNSAANQLAAMPSLHFAWAAIVAAGVISTRRSRWSWLIVLHPLVTLLAIVATANHYWADAAVGGLLVAAAVSTSNLMTRPTPAFARMPAAAQAPAFLPGRPSFAQPSFAQPSAAKAPAFAFSSAFASAARFAQGPVSGPLGPNLSAAPRAQSAPSRRLEPAGVERLVEPTPEPIVEPAVVTSSLPTSRLRISRVSTITAVPVIAREAAGGRRHDLTARRSRSARTEPCRAAVDLALVGQRHTPKMSTTRCVTADEYTQP
jgi:hypothetical protein